MTALSSFSKFGLVLLIVFVSEFTNAQEEVVQAPLPACTEQFVIDFDSTFEKFMAVSSAIENNADEQTFRGTVIDGLNACHSFVASYVTVDPVTQKWVGAACLKGAGAEAVMLEPQFHKAECEYLQRLLDHQAAM